MNKRLRWMSGEIKAWDTQLQSAVAVKPKHCTAYCNNNSSVLHTADVNVTFWWCWRWYFKSNLNKCCVIRSQGDLELAQHPNSNSRDTPTGKGGHLHLGLMLGAAVCWKMRSAACSPGRMPQSGTTQGPVHQLAYGGPSSIKTEWIAPPLLSQPVCLPAILGHVGSPWRQGPARKAAPHFRAKKEAVWVMRRCYASGTAFE